MKKRTLVIFFGFIACMSLVYCINKSNTPSAETNLNKIDGIKVVKHERQLYLLSNGSIVSHYPVVLGTNPIGHKQREGDGRTPEGSYVLDRKNKSSQFYRSIHLSYPNAQDIKYANENHVQPGSDIMLHGQRNGFGWLSSIMQRFDWTAGCIALSNEDLDKIWVQINEGTPIIIEP